MNALPGRFIDAELLALDSGLFDTLPPAKPLTGRAIDWHVMSLQSGLFDRLPPPPPLEQMRDSLAPVIEAELRGESPAPVRSRGGSRAATAIGVCVGLAMMVLGVGLRHREMPAPAAPAVEPRAAQTIVLPEIVIVGDLRADASTPTKPIAAKPAARPRTRQPSKPVAAPHAARR